MKKMITILAVFMIGSVAFADINITDPTQLFTGSLVTQDVKMAFGTQNLEVYDVLTGLTSIAGSDGTDWWLLYFDIDEGVYYPVGYGKNTYVEYYESYPDYAGWISGWYENDLNLFDEDHIPDDVLVVHDLLGDGFALQDSGILYPGADDEWYWASLGQIAFNGIVGAVDQLPAWDGVSTTLYLPDITVIVPEPATLGILALGAIGVFARRRV